MITVTDNCQKRVAAEREKPGQEGAYLRILVDSGGCSGFEYRFSWELAAPGLEDTVYAGVVVIDDVSLPFMRDASVDFVQTLMGADFKVTNPQAVSGCGCGHSFAVSS